MASVLVTAFEPYDDWTENSSWLALVELTKNLPQEPLVTTRLYPVDYEQVRQRLQDDLTAGYDFALHLGQSPGAAELRLEAVGLNVGTEPLGPPDACFSLIEGGPAAYRSELPLADWAASLRAVGIPAAVSFHAGTYLCNALLYLSQYTAQETGMRTKSVFLHVPLEVSQVADSRKELPSLPSGVVARALRILLQKMGENSKPGTDCSADA